MPSPGSSATPRYDFARKPNAVIVNLGTNDSAPGDPGTAYEDAYVTFLRKVRSHYADAWIFLTIGTMTSDPMLTTRSCGPDGKFAGAWKFTWYTPAKPGAKPANWTGTEIPAIVTCTVPCANASAGDPTASNRTPAGDGRRQGANEPSRASGSESA